jgi:hypothetical protein
MDDAHHAAGWMMRIMDDAHHAAGWMMRIMLLDG